MRFSKGFRKYFVNTSWLMVERLMFMSLSLVVGIYVARYLGPQRFGLLNYAMSFVGLFSVFATLGLDQIIVREFVRDGADLKSLLGTVFLLKMIGGIIVLGVVFVALFFTDSVRSTKIIVFVIASGLIFQSVNVIDFYFQSQVISKYVVFAQIFQVFASSIVKLVLVFLNAELICFAFVVLLDNILLAAALFYFLRLRNIDLVARWKFDPSLAKKLLNESWPLALSGLVVTVYMKIDQVMIKEMLNAEAVGLYAVAVRLSEVWYFLPTIILKSLFPAIISLRENHQGIYAVRLQQLHDMLSFLAFPIAVFVCFYSENLVTFLFGGKFAGAGMILSVHIWAGLLVFPGNVRAHLIVLENKQVVALVFRSMGAIINVGLNYLLIPEFGPIGAAWATLASFLFPVVLVAFFDPLIRLTVFMTLKSYCLPFRLLLFRRSLYSVSS